MNTFQLILKQMRQRALSSWLTILSVLLGVALATSVFVIQRQGEQIFSQQDYGFNGLISARGSKLQSVLNVVYNIDQAPGTIPWQTYLDLLNDPDVEHVQWAVPFEVGDGVEGLRVMGVGGLMIDRPELSPIREELMALGRKLRDESKQQMSDVEAKKLAFGIHASLQVQSDRMREIDPHLADALDSILNDIENASTAKLPEVGERLFYIGQSVQSFEYGMGNHLELASGSPFETDRFEGIIGSNVEKIIGLKVGDEFQLEHGGISRAQGEKPDENADIHSEKWKVVGVLKPTGTPLDETIFVPLISTWCIGEHADFMEAAAEVSAVDEHEDHAHHDHAHDHDAPYELVDGRIKLNLHPEDLRISGVFVRTQPSYLNFNNLQFNIEQRGRAMMLNPAQEMSLFFQRFLGPAAKVLSGVAILTSVLAAVAILVSIYNSVVARLREIAILRALGATRARVLTLITLEAGFIGLVGGLVGVLMGYALVALGVSMQSDLKLPVSAWSFGAIEWIYLLCVVALCALAGIVPAMKAYRTSVAEGLTA
ncbi:MAG TPA: ABC transporter permease, partial [Tepidisphaeraceae bacterium]|nr:ABC transporter permease [Tepidisphaeraceae bacterium]